MRKVVCLNIVFALHASLGAPLLAQGYTPDEAPRRMTLAAGLEAELVAAEPLVRQPVAIEFDDAGRLWVIQYLQYPNPSGLKRAKVDRYSRTTYDRVPEPPPRGPKGNDRITILIDRDGDGRADDAKDFLTDLNLASGLAFGHGGVFVLQVPYLLFYADRDCDDVPDGEPDVLLSGFGMEDAHSVANSLTWGPDGWLYGCQGSTVTSKIRGIEFQQGVWRYHPITHEFELFCEGGGNSWGLDFDAHGKLFYSTNFGGYAMLHGVQGAYYWKQFGKHGALHNPYAYGYFDHVPHKNLHGGHVTVGGLIYQGDLIPSLRGKYVAADLLGHAMYWHELEPRGSTFTARHAGDLLLANDSWFAPSDVTVGPDGAIYVCDWHDQRTAHPDPDAEWDRSNGRIYRIKPKGAELKKTADVRALSSAELVARLGDTNDWYVRRARRVLADRRDPEVIFPLRRLASSANDERLALEALWALEVSGGLTDEFALRMLEHPSSDIRRWTVRLLGDARRVSPQVSGRLKQMASDEPDVTVRSQLACTAKRLPSADALAIIKGLVTYDDDAADPFVPLLVWWAIEAHADSAREQVVEMFCDGAFRHRPLVDQALVERIVRRYAAEATELGYLACAKLLHEVSASERDRLLGALELGLRDQSSERGGSAGTLFSNLAAGAEPRREASGKSGPRALPGALLREIEAAWRDDTSDLALIRLAGRLGRPAARARALALATDAQTPVEIRVGAIQLLGELGDKLAVDSLSAMLTSREPLPVQAAALVALGQFDDPAIATKLLAQLPSLDAVLRSKAIDQLLARKASALVLLAAVDEGKNPAKDVSVDALRSVAVHGDARLDALVKKHWGSVQQGTPEERLAEMRRISNDLRAGRGDPTVGKALFAKHCGTCHRLFGEGNQVGPELTHANLKNTDELLATIVNPSAVIRKEFLSYVVQTTDGRVLTGLLVDQTPGSVTLLSAKNERTTVPRDRIDVLNESSTSLMPENLLGPLKPQELRDLFSYLQGEVPSTAARP